MTREDVIGWLEYISDDARSKADGLVPTNIEIACGMAIDALKAQEPRVMTLEEARKLRADDVVWLEDKDKPKVIPAIFRNRHLWPHSAVMVLNFMRGDGVKVTAGEDDYGERWRCWTSRPTDEQRQAVKWDG